ncbi:WD40 repeat domain-containing protein [Streptomyces chartreusis]|uniref:WD40 repeat domain-containing protein n=1 Tax=Streptomyces chartreusis TaxID=1969 RepID=UPI00369386B8
MASGGVDGTVRLWDPATRTQEHDLTSHTDAVTALCTVQASDGRILLASGSLDRMVRLWGDAGILRTRIPVGDEVRALVACGGVGIALARGLLVVDVGDSILDA